MNSRWTRLAAYGVIFALGFFALAAQALLFRGFLSVFEGNELGMVCFFSSWLLWVAAGALVGRILPAKALALLRRNFDLLTLLYVPAYLLQAWLIAHARELAGIQSYELFPLLRMLAPALLVNLPVCLCTGLLFTLACDWMPERHLVPTTQVYLCETVGSFAGGIAVTALLANGVAGETIWLWATTLLATAFCLHRLALRSRVIAFVPLVIALAALVTGVGDRRESMLNRRAWEQRLPGSSYQGCFATPQCKYLYGEYQGQFNVVAHESVVDSIPATEHASQAIASLLPQVPQARRILVVGAGCFPVCSRLLTLPGLESVTWFDFDPDYPPALLAALPERFKPNLDRLVMPRTDVRRHLEKNPADKYDLVILNLPDITSLAMNRYATTEFFSLLYARLAENGAVAVRVSGGDNFMGDELANMGASVFSTLQSVFKRQIIRPGDETWIVASDGNMLSTAAAELRDRFRAIDGAAALYPPDGVLSLYPPDRVRFQTDFYTAAVADAPGELLRNTDLRPKALFYSLLFASRQAGATTAVAAAVRTFAVSGALVIPLGICIFVLLRLLYLEGPRGRKSASQHGVAPDTPFDSHVLVLSTGAVGMGLGIILMFMFQSCFGSIFLYAGLITAIFMLGLSAGGFLAAHLVAKRPQRHNWVLMTALLLQAVFMGIVGFLPADLTPACFAALFLAAGLLGGACVPVAALRLKNAGFVHRNAGAAIEANDSIGGAVGGLIAGLLLLPAFGRNYTLAVLALVLGANLPALLPLPRTRHLLNSLHPFDTDVHAAGYAMSGVAIFALATSLIFGNAASVPVRQLFEREAQTMVIGEKLVPMTGKLADGRRLEYFAVHDEKGAVRGYVFCTDAFAGDIVGYGGPIILAVRVAVDGAIDNLRVVKSAETPAYLYDLIAPWLSGLRGHKAFAPGAFSDMDAVTGATISSSAIIRILARSCPAFATDILGMTSGAAGGASAGRAPDLGFVFIIATALVALGLRLRPSLRTRRMFLVLVVLAGGVWLNAQYSVAHVFSLLGARPPPPGLTASFLLVCGIPILVLLTGNIYCGYMCPFGALQELVSELRPEQVAADPEKRVWRWARLLKYVLLFVAILFFALTRDHTLASADPLTTVFAGRKTALILFLAACVLVLSCFYRRFWCRNLCVAGAFLSMFNGLRLLKWFSPPVHVAKCDQGVMNHHDLDCLCCDRCRCKPEPDATQDQPRASIATRDIVFLVLVLLSAALFIGQLILDMEQSRLASASSARPAAITGGGAARKVDMTRLRGLIEQNQLSTHEAVYYKIVPENPAVPPSRPAGTGDSPENESPPMMP